MTEHPSDAEAVFLAALERASAAERAAYVEGACAGRPELLRRVRELLAAHEESHGPLDVPPAGVTGTVDMPPPVELPGTIIGRYKLLQKIGEGGMGVVYLAEQQEPVRRQVALKVIKPGMDSEAVLARFEAERQALALMDHPNIAKVLDAGTAPTTLPHSPERERGRSEGAGRAALTMTVSCSPRPGERGSGEAAPRPYFVMELVKGVPITRYCDEHRLTPPERLELFVTVCQAVQHAHQKGIIHRDLKPSNVLVASYDGKPVPKVIDFGVAKATGQRLTERTLFTGFGVLVGTLEYMSPEQAEFNALDVDTRSDVYALGVLLYELLTGTTPLTRPRLKQAALAEALRVIREEDPPRPSTRLSESVDSLASVSAQRRTDPAKLTKLVRGELDWIVMKALEKDRGRRYDTASALARDVGHYLEDEPVEAGPPSMRYRVRKFLCKHRAGVWAAAAVLIALLVGFVATTLGLLQAERAAAEEARQRNEAREANANLRQARDALRETLYAAQANLIQHAWDANDLGRIRELLRAQIPAGGAPDLRGFERYFWDRRAHAALKTVPLEGAGGVVGSLGPAVSPDGTRVVGWCADPSGLPPREVRVWDTASGATLLTLAPPRDTYGWSAGPHSPTFDASGKRVLLQGKTRPRPQGGGEAVYGCWDAVSGQVLFMIRQPYEGAFPPQHVALSPDGKRFAAAVTLPDDKGGAQAVKVWDTATGKALLLLKGRSGRAAGLAFSPDSTTLAAAFATAAGNAPGGDVKVWSVAGGEERLTLDSLRAGVPRLAFTPDGRALALIKGSVGDWRLSLVDLRTGKELPAPHWAAGVREPLGFADLAFSPDGQRFAVPGSGGVRVRETATGRLLAVFKGHAGQVRSAAFSRDGARLVTAGADGTACVWPASPGDEPVLLEGPANPLHRLVFNANGTRIAAVSSPAGSAAPSEIRVWDVSGRRLFLAAVPFGPGTEREVNLPAVALSADGRRVAAARCGLGRGGRPRAELRVWDVDTGKELYSLGGESSWFQDIALSPDGLLVAAPDMVKGKNIIRVWDIATGREHGRFPVGSGATQTLAFSPDGTRLASVGGALEEPPVLKVWELASGRELWAVKDTAAGPPAADPVVAFSPDGRRIAWAGGRGGLGVPAEVTVTDAADGRPRASLKGHAGSIAHLAFSPDGRRIVSVDMGHPNSNPGRAQVWDAATGSPLLTLAWEGMTVRGAGFSRDGHRLYTAGLGLLISGRVCVLKPWDGTPR